MQTELTEREWVDLDAVPRDTCRVTGLTDAAEPR